MTRGVGQETEGRASAASCFRVCDSIVADKTDAAPLRRIEWRHQLGYRFADLPDRLDVYGEPTLEPLLQSVETPREILVRR